ncbi:hypothetical protein EJ07DRAFT_151932 [Lizonia empirigonia]|nr:hypothetical protein EJ07DRAFT_151932 [Lizonia empirigonia]
MFSRPAPLSRRWPSSSAATPKGLRHASPRREQRRLLIRLPAAGPPPRRWCDGGQSAGPETNLKAPGRSSAPPGHSWKLLARPGPCSRFKQTRHYCTCCLHLTLLHLACCATQCPHQAHTRQQTWPDALHGTQNAESTFGAAATRFAAAICLAVSGKQTAAFPATAGVAYPIGTQWPFACPASFPAAGALGGRRLHLTRSLRAPDPCRP